MSIFKDLTMRFFNPTLIMIMLSSIAAHAQFTPIFNTSVDVGSPELKGSMTYSEENQTYKLQGAGANMWFGQDQFQFAYRKITGDFILRTHVSFEDKLGDPHKKMGLMNLNPIFKNDLI